MSGHGEKVSCCLHKNINSEDSGPSTLT